MRTTQKTGAVPVDTVWHTSDTVCGCVYVHIVWHGGAHFDSLWSEGGEKKENLWKKPVVPTADNFQGLWEWQKKSRPQQIMVAVAVKCLIKHNTVRVVYKTLVYEEMLQYIKYNAQSVNTRMRRQCRVSFCSSSLPDCLPPVPSKPWDHWPG